MCVPDLLALNPAVTDVPGATRLFHSTFLACTARFDWVHVAPQPCWIRSPAVKENSSRQPFHAVRLVFVIVSCAVRPVGHVDALYSTLHPAGAADG